MLNALTQTGGYRAVQHAATAALDIPSYRNDVASYIASVRAAVSAFRAGRLWL